MRSTEVTELVSVELRVCLKSPRGAASSSLDGQVNKNRVWDEEEVPMPTEPQSEFSIFPKCVPDEARVKAPDRYRNIAAHAHVAAVESVRSSADV